MLITKILDNVNIEDLEASSQKEIVKVCFDWFELEKRRIFKVAEDGTDIGLQLNEPIKDGDLLAENETKIYVAVIEKLELTKIKISSIIEMGRACFELGNRHLSLKIEENSILTPFDQPTFEYLAKAGFDVEKVFDKFSNFIECKAHGTTNKHSHAHSHEHTHEHSHGESHTHVDSEGNSHTHTHI